MAEQTITLLGTTVCPLHYMELRSPICIHKHLNIKLIMPEKKIKILQVQIFIVNALSLIQNKFFIESKHRIITITN